MVAGIIASAAMGDVVADVAAVGGERHGGGEGLRLRGHIHADGWEGMSLRSAAERRESAARRCGSLRTSLRGRPWRCRHTRGAGRESAARWC